MSLAVCLLAYSMVVAVLGPPLLGRGTRDGVAPRLGIGAWIAAMASVPAAWAGAVALFGAELVRAWGQVERLFTGCFAVLLVVARGGHGGFLQAGLAVLTVLTALALAVLVALVTAALRRARTHTRNHADAARLAAAGTPPGPGGALVVDAEQLSVYCLAGRPHTIVITRAALAALDDAQLAAVLAHERAHLTGRHHQLLAQTRAMATILPGLRLFTEGATDVARLAEMCADDDAARRHGRDTLVDALVALTTPAPVPAGAGAPGPVPAGALDAAGGGVAQRAERLLFPPDPIRARLALGVTLGGLLLGPVFLSVLMISAPLACGPVL